MESIASDVIGGFNAFLAEQQSQLGDCSLTLIQFDDRYESGLRGVSHLRGSATHRRYVPAAGQHGVARRDWADHRRHRYRLAALPEDERPERVMLVIVTDGLENASTDFSRERVFGMISTQQDVYKWSFLFLAANQDAIAEGEKVGIGARGARPSTRAPKASSPRPDACPTRCRSFEAVKGPGSRLAPGGRSRRCTLTMRHSATHPPIAAWKMNR